MGGEDVRFTWRELQETPWYVIRFCWDLRTIKRRCTAERASREKPPGGVR